ncbi:MAG TPA: hypothetical protein VH370_02825 [Humisphaera sp.]|nr:hypothetical protein [Humisphaera sp.]
MLSQQNPLATIYIMRVKDLMNRLHDNSFRGFRVHLSDGSAIAVTEPGMIIVGPSSAVLPTEYGREQGERVATRWRTVALAHMVQFSDLGEPIGGKSRKRK